MPAPNRPLSPEMLHQGIRLVRAPTWILAVVLLGAVAAALLWGIFGTVLVQVAGRGLLIHADNQQVPVFSAEQARLRKTRVSIGDEVTAGQPLFDLDAASIDTELQLATQRLQELQNVQNVVSANAAKALGDQDRISGEQLSALGQQYQQLKAQADYYTTEVTNQDDLLKKGLATADKVEAMREKRDDAALQLVQSEGKRIQVESDLLLGKMSWQRQQMDAQLAVDQQQAKISEITERRKRASQIVAQRDGFVSEILVNDGQLVAAGSKVAIVSTRGAGYQVLAFFKPLDGKRLVAGMETDIVPSTVKREEYGTMKGVVGDTSIRPMSLEQTTELLGNETLARYLTSDDPPIVGRITVATRPGEPDAFAWRNGSGPPFPVTTGTVADVKVTVQRQAPIVLVLPYLKTLVGW